MSIELCDSTSAETTSNKASLDDSDSNIDDGYVSQDFQLSSTMSGACNGSLKQQLAAVASVEEASDEAEEDNFDDQQQQQQHSSLEAEEEHQLYGPQQRKKCRSNSAATNGAFCSAEDSTDDDDADMVPVFRGTGFVKPALRDSLAGALLMLQVSVESSNERLDNLEGRVSRLEAQRDATSRQQTAAANSSRSPLLASDYLLPVVYLAWPLAVYAGLRALDKRRQ